MSDQIDTSLFYSREWAHSSRFRIYTFGCKVNTYDTGLMENRLEQAGFERNENSPLVHILNTCAVTAEATKEAQRWVRRIKAKNPFSWVVVTGCAAQVDTDKFSHLNGVDLVVANSHKSQLPDLILHLQKGNLKERIYKSNIFKKMELEEGGGKESHHTRAFLKIQDGCDSFCTYCVIPFARGKSRSLPIKDLVIRVQELVDKGVKEVVLVGVHIGDYIDENFSSSRGPESLIEQILQQTSLPRLRLSSLEPIEVTDHLLELFQEDRVCSHFHMSIQSASTSTLKAMKRKYQEEEVESCLLKINKYVPNAFVGMDVIVGFPSESEVDFQETYQRLNHLPWTQLHVFPYSERPGTFAARHLKSKVNKPEIVLRAKKLREMSERKYFEHALRQVGLKKQTLILKETSHGFEGLSRDYWPIQIRDQISQNSLALGEEIQVEIERFNPSSRVCGEAPLFGRVLLTRYNNFDTRPHP